MDLVFVKRSLSTDPEFELIERKGTGHPDTLSDALAEELSRRYSLFTRERYGAVLHHNFDKVGLLGGQSEVAFGRGRLTSPIRVLLNGRASSGLGDDEIPLRRLLEAWSSNFLKRRLPLLSPDRDLEFHYNVSTGASPGHVGGASDAPGVRQRWFRPRTLADLRERQRLASNDTSVGCAHFPFSHTERLVKDLEGRLTSPESQRDRPWLGTDIKVMACRTGNNLSLTLCIPQIADFVPSLSAYRENVEEIRAMILDFVSARCDGMKVSLQTNTKDDYELPELYLTALGTSLETGDEGLVGRGNRPNGMISMLRPYSMEGACGKNPVYHAGKIYNAVASEIALRIFTAVDAPIEVWIVSQEGRALSDPWKVVVCHDREEIARAKVEEAVSQVLGDIPSLTEKILRGELELC
jgi:S-adenosylmethionine synthetase